MKPFRVVFSFICCVVFAGLFSCSEKAPEKLPEPLKTCRPESTTQNFGGSLTDVDSIKYGYNAAGQLIQRSYYNGVPGRFTNAYNLIYDANGRLYQLTDQTGRLEEQRQYNANGLLSRTTGYTYFNGDTLAGEADYEYTASGQIKKVVGYKVDGGIRTMTDYRTFMLNSEGLVVKDSVFFISANGSPAFFTSSDYAYDAKVGVSKFGIEPSNLHEAFRFFAQKHNVVSEKRIQNGVPGVHTVTFQYVYNANNYPVKVDVINQGRIESTLKIRYSCF